MTSSVHQRYTASIMNTFGPPKLVLTRGEGAYVWDSEGNRYLDLLGGIAVNALGHAHPALVAAVTQQISTLGHVSNFFATEPQVALAERLLDLLGVGPGGGKVFFANSGSEANEAAFKLTRRTGRTHLVAAEGSFHGRTMGSLALTSKEAYREPFAPLPGEVTFVAYGDAEALAAAVTDRTAAVVIEPVQGEAGVVVPPEGYLQRAREITREHGALLWLDEVQTGMGRTGEWFAVNHWDVVPDLMSTAKGLTSSYLPLGAVAIAPEIAAHFDETVFYGGLTYNSHPLSCAAALAAIQVIEDDDLVGNAKRLEPVMRRHHEELARRHPSVGLHRNIGLFGCLELVRDAATNEPMSPYNVTNEVMTSVNRALLDRGLFTFVRWNVIHTNPPLCVTEEQLDEGFAIIDEALEVADRAVDA